MVFECGQSIPPVAVQRCIPLFKMPRFLWKLYTIKRCRHVNEWKGLISRYKKLFHHWQIQNMNNHDSHNDFIDKMSLLTKTSNTHKVAFLITLVCCIQHCSFKADADILHLWWDFHVGWTGNLPAQHNRFVKEDKLWVKWGDDHIR